MALCCLQPPITALPTRIPLSPALQVSSSSPVTVTALAVFLAPAKPGTAASSLQDRTGQDGTLGQSPAQSPQTLPGAPHGPGAMLPPSCRLSPSGLILPLLSCPRSSSRMSRDGEPRPCRCGVRASGEGREGKGREGGVEGGAGKALTDSSQWAPLRWLSRRQSFLSLGERTLRCRETRGLGAPCPVPPTLPEGKRSSCVRGGDGLGCPAGIAPSRPRCGSFPPTAVPDPIYWMRV